MNATASLCATSAVAVATLVAIDLGWSHQLGRAESATVVSTREADVVILSHDPANDPTPEPGASLLLVGNSHTYALPGLARGQILRGDPGSTLIDELERELVAQNPRRKAATFYRLANPNLLPIEMLVRVAALQQRGLSPSVTVVGLTWRNVARDASMRSEIRRVLSDEAMARALFARLRSAAADAAVIEALESAIREDARTTAENRQRGWADRTDERLQHNIGEQVTLIGRSPDIRADVYRRFAYALDFALEGQRSQTWTYDVVEQDRALNMKCLETLIRLTRSSGSQMVLYFAPERTDFPPLMNPTLADAFRRDVRVLADRYGAVVIDARNAVPNQYWGWEQDTADRSHFTEPGHAALANLLANSDVARSAFEALDAR